jgi:hypothetical protein
MLFYKKQIPWNKGKKMSEEQRKLLSKVHTGKKASLETRIKMSEARKGKKNKNFKCDWNGRKHSDESKIKMSISARCRKLSKVIRKKISKALLGKTHKDKGKNKLSLELRLNLSKKLRGINAPNWQGGLTDINYKIRHGIEHRLWREAVFARDNWTCQKTGERGGKLHPHHIQNFSDYPELRFAIDNGITLSEKAHMEFHKKYGVKNNTEEQLIEFIKL